MANDRPWQDESVLKRLYWDKEMNQYEIADQLGCSQSTVKDWMKKHDIESRERGYDISKEEIREANKENKTISAIADVFDVSRNTIKYRIDKYDLDLDLEKHQLKYDISESELRELYFDQQMSMAEIAELYDCMPNTIRDYMIRHGIDRRDCSKAISIAKKSNIVFSMLYSYEIIRDHYENPLVMHHRLIAVAEYGFDAVKEKDVHHKNGIRWDNRPDNLQLVTKEEHIKIHDPVKARWG